MTRDAKRGLEQFQLLAVENLNVDYSHNQYIYLTFPLPYLAKRHDEAAYPSLGVTIGKKSSREDSRRMVDRDAKRKLWSDTATMTFENCYDCFPLLISESAQAIGFAPLTSHTPSRLTQEAIQAETINVIWAMPCSPFAVASVVCWHGGRMVVLIHLTRRD